MSLLLVCLPYVVLLSFTSMLASSAVDQVKFRPPLRKVTEPYPDMVTHAITLVT